MVDSRDAQRTEVWNDPIAVEERLRAKARGEADLSGVSPERFPAWKYADVIATQRQRIAALEAALTELYAQVRGECPSLLNEDSDGDANLDLEIKRLLGESDG